MCYVGYISREGSATDGTSVSSVCTETDDTYSCCCCEHARGTRTGRLPSHCTGCHIRLSQT